MMKRSMPSLGDSAFIFFLALLLFGPKKLPELARQLGKLMAEFRRASNEFKMQMEEELRLADQAEQQKKTAALEAAAPSPATPVENTIATPATVVDDPPEIAPHERDQEALTIASSGDIKMMPPATGLPVANSSVSHAFDSVPHRADPDLAATTVTETFDPSEGHTPDAPDHVAAETASEVPSHG
ncbi:MAG TPA: twin-arginine translocase TatA/TatE family subunit [Edaphobacter sp.]